MFLYYIAYRHENGEVEGFAGTALTDEFKARDNAIRKVRDKISYIPDNTYDETRLIETDACAQDLTPEEWRIVRGHWEISRRSQLV